MKINNVGGIIVAASIKRARPMLQLGSIPIVKRVVLAFQQAGIFPIVIITGTQEDEVRHELSEYGVIFLKNEDCQEATMFDSLKIGLSYLQDKCSHIAITPVNSPMFSPETLKILLDTKGDVTYPVYKEEEGYPVLISSSVIPDILHYNGEEFKGAIHLLKEYHVKVEVEDEGVVQDVHSYEQLQKLLEQHNRALMQAAVGLSIEKESVFFNNRTKLLLYLITETKSVNKACELMSMSYTKAWKVLNKLEFELGYTIVQRRQGGSRYGRTLLTEKGMEFLSAYFEYEDRVIRFAQSEFDRIFKEKQLI
nr:NTP transferase domain-containing protein [uncultured Anaerocolumna sp.]